MTTMITIQKDVTHDLRTTICMLQQPWFIHGSASVVKDDICLQNGCKQAWMYETRNRNEKNVMQEIPGKIRCTSGNQCDPPQKNRTSPLLITHFSNRPFSKMPVGGKGGAFARKHSIPMYTTNINQIIHVTWQYSTLIVRIHWTFLKQGAKYEHISHKTI